MSESIVGPIFSSQIKKGEKKIEITVVPSVSGWFQVGKILSTSDGIPVSYTSPEFQEEFSEYREYVDKKEKNWACYLEYIGKNVPRVTRTLNPISLSLLFFIATDSKIGLDGKIIVAPVIDANKNLRFVTMRWSGKGWVFRSYPPDFPRVLRRDRKLIFSADIIS